MNHKFFRQQGDAILEELKAIRALLTGAMRGTPLNTPAREPVVKGSWKADERWILGSPMAPVTLVEFTDYQCPFCRQFHTTTFEEIRKKYVDTGEVRFISADFPLEIHSNATRAAEAARCAADQNRFWQMRDVLSANAAKLAYDDLLGYAQGLHLDIDVFRSCLESGKYAETVATSQKAAANLGVSATPSFLVGKSTADGVDGVLLVGAAPLPVFDAKIREFQQQ
jgi:protein-disulfide isomerase